MRTAAVIRTVEKISNKFGRRMSGVQGTSLEKRINLSKSVCREGL